MPVWKAKMETAYYDDTRAYEDDDGYTIYAGKDHGNGHYILECDSLQGKATLHQIVGSRFLEGSWLEEGSRGFWKIILLE